MEETTIKIARRGSKGHLHNGYLGTEYIECLAETEDRFKLRFGAATVWVDKTFIDIRVDGKWQPAIPIDEEVVAMDIENPLLQEMDITFARCFSIAIAKNSDYGGSNKNPFANFENSVIAGVSVERGILVRLMDKMSRISTLLDKEAKVKDEAITDTIEDAINYLAILKAYITLKDK